MADIATLGLALDSRPIVVGVKALDDLTRAAKPATTATTNLGKAAKDAGGDVVSLGGKTTTTAKHVDDLTRAAMPATTAATALGKASKDTTATATALGKATMGAGTNLDKFAKSGKTANDNIVTIAKSGNLAQHEMVNLGRQAQDVGTMLAMGASPMQVVTSQFAQVLDIFTSSKNATVGGAIRQIGRGIAGIITPTRLAGLGLAAVATSGLVMYSSWKSSTLALDDAARSADLTTRELSKLQAVASFKGISNDDFNKGISGFARGVYDAKNGMGGLAEVFAVNNKHAATFDGYLGKAADLIKNARSDQQRLVLLQQMGLPATMEWVRLLSQGSEGLNRAKEAAAEFVANDDMIAAARRFDETWNRAWTNFGLNARSAFQTALDAGGSLLDRIERLAQSAGSSSIWNKLLPSDYEQRAKSMGITRVSPFNQRFSGDSQNPVSGNSALSDALRAEADRRRNQPTLDAAAVQHDIQMQQQRLAVLSQVATVNETIKQSELALTAARMQPGNKITNADVARIREYTRATALGITAIQASADAYRIDAATTGMATGAAASYAAVQTRINEEHRKGNVLTASNIAAIKAEATALGQAAANAENMRFAYENLVRGPMQTFQQQIANGASGLDALKASGVSALNAISSKLMDMAAQNLWSNAFGGGGSGGGFLSSIFGGVFGGGSGASSSIMVGGYSMPKFASGTDSAPGGLARVNEQGGEIMNLPNGTQVIPHDVSMAMVNRVAAPSSGGGSSTPQSVHVTVGVSVDDDGKIQAYVKDVAQDTSQRAITGFVKSPGFAQTIAVANRKGMGMRN
ncbi:MULTISPECIES: phage tail length tape measure family protein [Rhodopseudomonas]|uniref:Bacteriophage tail tape measure N-terminal domain-containing protein n=1 Tax=Rhodopseudomonas palustris TaxID=1076 RepID=A0A0D7EBQ9_RHOPL|nr:MULTISPECIES: phage tail length tape measure family protein [Rhodopseudomonas]KIZ38066.1 hypothetical protein OO17_23140 [Rhodopseudomonas palustris]MDF3810543.1 phage tail length tape measure family protein [Rhodopseudomonas sp. BAL398]WOK18397.1 phage tail length tape measure family protein [Rhodopseudomonas sp. BAL398]